MKKLFKFTFKISLIFILIGFIAAIVLITDAYSVKLNTSKLSGNFSDIKFFDKENNEIIETDILFNKKPEDKLPQHTYNAFIAIEDKRFNEHNGIDVKRILGATLANVKAMSFKEGASTISQQLIKNTQLTSEKTLFRKSREIKLALELEKNYTKEEIINMYLNIIYFGSGCYGIENASFFYFNKSATMLNLNESAALAAIIKAPTAYSPFSNYNKLLARKDVVLKKMYENKLITQEEYYQNKGKDIVLCKAQDMTNNYNDYIKVCLNEISEILNIPVKEIKSLNYKVFTYMDSEQQKNLHNVIKNKEYYFSYENTDSAGIVINNKDFSVSAYALKSKVPYNNLIRQPGSAIKPVLVYAPALEYNLISPATEILDEKTNFESYSPSNYNNKYYGYTDTRNCLAKSLNIPAVKVLNSVGIDKAKSFARRCGINFNSQDNNLGLALGGFNEGVSLIDLASGFVPFSNGGNYKKPQFIRKITDENGRPLYSDIATPQQIMREDTAYLISDMLKYSITNGTASKLGSLKYPLSSKTGTVGNSNFNTDAYNISYTTENTFAVWMGGLEKKLDLKVTGGTYPTIMIKDIIKNCYNDYIPSDFIRPESVVECDIDTEYLKRNHSVKLATEMTPEKFIKKSIFSVHYLPREFSDCFSSPCIDESEIKLENNKINIKFTAKNYLDYEIIRITNNKEEVISTITDKEGIVEIVDDKISYGKTYQYNIVPQFTNKKLNKTIKGRIFMSNKIVVPYKFSPDEDYFDDEYNDEKWYEEFSQFED